MEILRPMENLMETSILKTHIKMPPAPGPSITVELELRGPIEDIEIEDRRTKLKNKSGQVIAEYPRDPSRPQIITLFVPFLGPVQFEIKPNKRVRRRSGKKNTTNYNLKKRAFSRESSIQNEAFPQSRPSSPLVSPSSSNYESSALVRAESDPQKYLQHYLNTHLIYFRVVKKKIQECLTTSALKPSQKSLEDLDNLRKDLECFLDKLETFYYEKEVLIAEIENNPLFQEILKCAEELQDVFKKLNESEIPKFLETTVPNSNEHTLCSILGLNDEAAEALRSLNSETRSHLTDEQWIQDFLENKGKNLHANEHCDEVLNYLGFTPVKSKALSKLFQNNPYFDHQSATEWAKDHIEQQFKYNILLAGHKQDGCTKPYNLSGSYEDDFDIELEDSIVVKGRDSFMLDKQEIHQVPWLSDYLSQEKNSLQGAKFWFHGTDHESALNIIKEGINLGASRRKLDFSSGNGFYLSTDYEMAHMWSTSRINKTKTAVIVFKVPSEIFLDDEGMTFSRDCDEWKNIVSFFRKDMTGCASDQKKKYKGLKYIFGPMAGDGFHATNPTWIPRAKEPVKYQLCIRDEDLAEMFYADGKNIVKGVFFHDLLTS